MLVESLDVDTGSVQSVVTIARTLRRNSRAKSTFTAVRFHDGVVPASPRPEIPKFEDKIRGSIFSKSRNSRKDTFRSPRTSIAATSNPSLADPPLSLGS
ncbi:hypothetical protein KM043_018657 [Ampulex compressa]|nr:hypothetical protein KM043_018657 [Ampulex compressa]